MASKQLFFSRSNLPKSCRVCCRGSRVADTYSDSFDDNGVACVVKSGESNLHEYIQSFESEVDIYKIMDRLLMCNGSVPPIPATSYGDISSIPDNVHDALKTVQHAQNVFNSMPVELRKEYNNNFMEFMSDFGSERFMSFFNVKPDVKPDVNGGENNA